MASRNKIGAVYGSALAAGSQCVGKRPPNGQNTPGTRRPHGGPPRPREARGSRGSKVQAGVELDYFIPKRLSYSIPPPEVAVVASGILFWCSHGTGTGRANRSAKRSFAL
jgi:hypothetical protein